jgi:chromosome segregation ATPase
LAAEQKYREKAEDSLQEYQRTVNSIENQLHEAVTAAESSEKELEELTIELHNAYQSIRLVEKKYSEMIDENAGQRKKSEEAHANLEVILRERENQIRDIESQYSKAKSELESHRMQNEKLCEEMDVAHETISSLRIENDEHEQKYQQLLEEYRDARSIDDSQLSEKDALITKLQRKNESLERKRARLRDYVNSLNAKCSAWEESIQEQQTEASTFRTKYMQAKSQIEQLMKELKEQRKADMNLSCEDCKYLRRALVMEVANNSQKDDNVEE